MNISITRRAAIIGTVTVLPIVRSLAAARPGADAIVAATQAIETLERKNGGRLGVMALDTGTNATIEHRPSVQRQSWKSRRPAIFRLPIGRPLC